MFHNDDSDSKDSSDDSNSEQDVIFRRNDKNGPISGIPKIDGASHCLFLAYLNSAPSWHSFYMFCMLRNIEPSLLSYESELSV